MSNNGLLGFIWRFWAIILHTFGAQVSLHSDGLVVITLDLKLGLSWLLDVYRTLIPNLRHKALLIGVNLQGQGS